MSIIVSAPVHRIEINFVRRDESTQLRISAHPPLLLGAYQFASIIPARDGKLNIETVAIHAGCCGKVSYYWQNKLWAVIISSPTTAEDVLQTPSTTFIELVSMLRWYDTAAVACSKQH